MSKIYQKIGIGLYKLALPFIRPVIRHSTRAYVVIIYDKQIVLVKNWLARDNWRLPGGGLKKGESPEHAVIREVKGELRLVLKQEKLVFLNKGTAKSDKLGYRFSNYYYVMDTYPRILPNIYEIVDHGLFSSLPKEMHLELTDVVSQLMTKKLL